MKTSLLMAAAVAMTALPLFACQSAGTGQAADRGDSRQICVSGQGPDGRVVSVPQDRSPVDSQAPYALRGDRVAPTNVSSYARSGTNGS